MISGRAGKHEEVVDTSDKTSLREQEYVLSSITYFGYRVFGYAYELYTDGADFITKCLYPQASEEGCVVVPAFLPALIATGYGPQVVVLGPHDQAALQKLFQLGEKQFGDDDPAARNTLRRVEVATGASPDILIPVLRNEKARQQRKMIKNHLNNIPSAYRATYRYANRVFDDWQDGYTYQENIRYIVANVIAQCVFGIPEVPMEMMGILQEMSYVLAKHQPHEKVFLDASKRLQEAGKRMIERQATEVLASDKYIKDQFAEGDGLERLRELNAGSSILVEGNLSNITMIALERIMNDQVVCDKLRRELNQSGIDFALLPETDDALHAQYKKLNELPYLNKVYMEILRFVQPAVMIARQTSKATEWDVKDQEGNPHHYKVNAGSYFFAPLRAMAHDSKIWKEPEKFNPDRFGDDEKNAFFTRSSYPFMIGTRSCPAAPIFAKLVFKLFVAKVVNDYDFRLSDKMQPIPASSTYPILEPELSLVSVSKHIDLSNGPRPERTIGQF